MKKVIPIQKLNKKAQNEYHTRQRGSWNGLSPATRIVPNGKFYDRNRIKQADLKFDD